MSLPQSVLALARPRRAAMRSAQRPAGPAPTSRRRRWRTPLDLLQRRATASLETRDPARSARFDQVGDESRCRCGCEVDAVASRAGRSATWFSMIPLCTTATSRRSAGGHVLASVCRASPPVCPVPVVPERGVWRALRRGGRAFRRPARPRIALPSCTARPAESYPRYSSYEGRRPEWAWRREST